METNKISNYHNSLIKIIFNYILAIFLSLIFLVPSVAIAILIKVTSKGPVFFRQKRVGKMGKVFFIYKFRTMKQGSEKERKRILQLNEVDGPVFKIKNDPRFTKFGKILSHSGMDEIPQLINVLKGDMHIVSPRPLPLYEYYKLEKKYRVRNLIKPGITSSWVVGGLHRMTFEKWMALDKRYVYEATILDDIRIMYFTFLILIKNLFKIN